MLSQIERFLSKYPTIIQTIAAISTFSAVITSLWIAQASNKPKISAKVSAAFPIYNDPLFNLNEEKTYISIDIKNKGNSPIYLSTYSLYWSAHPFTNMNGLITTITPIPEKIEPGTNATIIISEFPYICKKLNGFLGSRFIHLKINFLKLNIKLQNGYIFQAKICKGIKNIIIRG